MNIFREAHKLIEANTPFAMATILESKGSTPRHSAKMIILENGDIMGTIGGGLVEKNVMDAAIEAIKDGHSKTVSYKLNKEAKGGLEMQCGGDISIFIEVHGSRPRLLLIGGGHVNLAVYELAINLGYDVSIIDERPEFAHTSRYTKASLVLAESDYKKAVKEVGVDAHTAVVVATKDADEKGLRSVIDTSASYIGVIGSKRKIRKIMDNLKIDEYSQERLHEIHAPIGLDIGSETPVEIAVSIMAEVLKVRENASGISCKSLQFYNKELVIVRSGGDVASGTIQRLHNSGYKVLVTEVENPTVIRRTVSFAQAVRSGEMIVEGIKAVKATNVDEVEAIFNKGHIPVVVDPKGEMIKKLVPAVVVDGILAKKNMGTFKEMAPVVIGLGPGFEAGKDVHAVIETNRGHNLGRVIYSGKPEANTGNPGNIMGYTRERVVRSPHEGVVEHIVDIGAIMKKGDPLCKVGETVVPSPLDGVVRGLIENNTKVPKDFKIGDVDPRGLVESCYRVSDKARAIAGGVLEAMLYLENQNK